MHWSSRDRRADGARRGAPPETRGGLFDEARKRRCRFCCCIGVVTSRRSCHPRHPAPHLGTVSAPRSGLAVRSKAKRSGRDRRPRSMASMPCGTRTLPRPDVISSRGAGGHFEDLWSFNEESSCAAAGEACAADRGGRSRDGLTLIDHARSPRANPTAAAEKACRCGANSLLPSPILPAGRLARQTVSSNAAQRFPRLLRALPQSDSIFALRRQLLDISKAASQARAQKPMMQTSGCALSHRSRNNLRMRNLRQDAHFNALEQRLKRCGPWAMRAVKQRVAHIEARLAIARTAGSNSRASEWARRASAYALASR